MIVAAPVLGPESAGEQHQAPHWRCYGTFLGHLDPAFGRHSGSGESLGLVWVECASGRRGAVESSAE